MRLRQSLKAVKLGYLLCLAAELAIGIYWIAERPASDVPLWAPMLVPMAFALFIAIRHIRRRMTLITVAGDHVRYEFGLAGKTTRTVELMKVQDVSVHQTLGQRLLNIGDISLETAGVHSPIVMTSIDNPHVAAEYILKMAHAAAKQTP
ncbi:MAG TPA: PH domain-containing protein [Bryobacteraceae bacterium]|nr:PH domain-containing protein [Bryobacteraceae bacterium]